jgi:cation transport regulator ChaB
MAESDYLTAYTQLITQALQSAVDITTPTTFTSQVTVAKQILSDDCTGLISPIIEFMINSICDVEFSIETDNEEVTKILNDWLKNLNVGFEGKVPTGFNTVLREYLTERWTSSLMITQVNWNEENKYVLPSEMWVLDAEKITGKGKTIEELTYKFGSKELKEDIYIHKLGRMSAVYPVPYLIKRVYKNWAIKHYLKKKGAELIQQVLIYLALLKKGAKGTPAPTTTGNKELDLVLTKLKEAIDTAKAEGKTPIHVTGMDAELEHIIPDLQKALGRAIYEEVDRDILSGLGLIDIVQGIGSTRKESILNPKPLMEEVFNAVKDVKTLLLDIVKDIVKKNKDAHGKYFGEANLKSIRIVNTPVKSFWTDEFLALLRADYDRGLVDYKTYIEAFGLDFQTVYKRKLQDMEKGLEVVFYPPVILNQESQVSPDEDIKQTMEKPPKQGDETLPDDELPDGVTNPVEKTAFKKSSLEGSPYQTVEDINPTVRKSIADAKLLDAFKNAFNGAWKTYADKDPAIREQICMKVAWKQVKLMGYRGTDGKWHIKDKYSK